MTSSTLPAVGFIGPGGPGTSDGAGHCRGWLPAAPLGTACGLSRRARAGRCHLHLAVPVRRLPARAGPGRSPPSPGPAKPRPRESRTGSPSVTGAADRCRPTRPCAVVSARPHRVPQSPRGTRRHPTRGPGRRSCGPTDQGRPAAAVSGPCRLRQPPLGGHPHHHRFLGRLHSRSPPGIHPARQYRLKSRGDV